MSLQQYLVCFPKYLTLLCFEPILCTCPDSLFILVCAESAWETNRYFLFDLSHIFFGKSMVLRQC